MAGVDGAGPQHGRHELVRLAIEDQQRVVHVLTVVAVVRTPLLITVSRIVRPIEVEHQMGRHACLLPRPQVDRTAVDASAISAGQVEAALAKLDRLIEDAMARTGVPGAAVAVVYNDAVVYERAFGVREVGKSDAVTPETVFQLASMSKSISLTVVAAVVGDGATTWDAVAADLLPGFALADPWWWTSQVTLRDLFSHRSGLPAYAGDGLTATFGYGREESVRRLRYVQPATPLRTSFAYTNLGLFVAAYAAAAVAGQTWEELADERLFGRLGMVTTSYRLAD